MSLELVGAREPLPTEQPVTHKRPFSGVPPQMSLEVRRFAVHFPTPGNVTAVKPFSAEARASWTQAFRLLTVRTVARRSARVAPRRGPRRSRQRGRRTPCQHGTSRSTQGRGTGVRVRGEHGFESVHEMLTGGQQMRGRTGAKSRVA